MGVGFDVQNVIDFLATLAHAPEEPQPARRHSLIIERIERRFVVREWVLSQPPIVISQITKVKKPTVADIFNLNGFWDFCVRNQINLTLAQKTTIYWEFMNG